METWVHEDSIETAAAPAAIWALWADVAAWPSWNGDIEAIELDGRFEAGSTILMTPFGQEPVRLRIAEAAEGERFVDEAEIGDVVVRTIHRIDGLDAGRCRIVYRMEMTGPGAAELGPDVGAQITADFPETLAALAHKAEG